MVDPITIGLIGGAAWLARKLYEAKTKEDCPHCEGTGKKNEGFHMGSNLRVVSCDWCGGSGKK